RMERHQCRKNHEPLDGRRSPMGITSKAGTKEERRSGSHKRLLYCFNVNRTSLDHLLLGKRADIDKVSNAPSILPASPDATTTFATISASEKRHPPSVNCTAYVTVESREDRCIQKAVESWNPLCTSAISLVPSVSMGNSSASASSAISADVAARCKPVRSRSCSCSRKELPAPFNRLTMETANCT